MPEPPAVPGQPQTETVSSASPHADDPTSGDEPSPPPAAADAPPGDEPETPDEVVEGEVVEGEVMEGEAGEKPAASAEPASAAQPPATEPEAAESGVPVAEAGTLRTQLDERTADLLRVTAEYANYRKRVDRDRALAADQATGAVLLSILPVLDDLDRAREHGDLVGPFGSVAEQLITALGKYGLTAFGVKGDPFDPQRHEAVAHMTSSEVTEPSCIDVLRRGYMLGERLLRPAMVAVADPD
ncbi:MAG: nucleotide exchange factor GrpE [Dactylosporangium sp.]|nr:nucleotide exchange factor GrpE [Dactylosporangium sp.]